MLVLSRRVNERIVIDSNIQITVVGVRGNQVRLGIQAPPWINIYREELILRADGIADHSSEVEATAVPVEGEPSGT